VSLICVGTPIRATGEANLSSVENAARRIASSQNGYTVLTEKSTVPVGTGEWIRRTAELVFPSADLDVASNPEFLREGKAVEDTLTPSRIVVGAQTDRAWTALRKLYQPILDVTDCAYVETDIATAELIKLASNAFLATFINTVADVCEASGADVRAVADAMGMDPRIGRAFLEAGIGYGGFCLPKDLAAFRHRASELGIDLSLLAEVARVNDERMDRLIARMRAVLWNLEGRIAVWGLSFKPDTDDIRDAPSLRVIEGLLEAGCDVAVYDPVVSHHQISATGATVATDPYSAASGAHAIVLCTEWRDLRAIDLIKTGQLMEQKVMFEGRNLFDPRAAVDAGFTYVGIGQQIRYPRPVEHSDGAVGSVPALATTTNER
jgi:UDPglucose 6-dehydrogenase